MTLIATYGSLNLNASPYSLLSGDYLSSAVARIVQQSYGGARPGGIVASVTPDLLTHPLQIGVSGTSFANLEVNLSALKKTLSVPRQRLVISNTDARFWVAIPQTVSVNYLAPAYAVATVPVLIEMPFQQDDTPTTVTSTGSMSATTEPTPSPSTYAALVAGQKPAGWWRMGDASGSPTILDSSANGNALAVTGTPTFGATGAISGDADTAITVNGTNQYFSGARAGLVPGDVFTFKGWFKRARSAMKEMLWDNSSSSLPQVFFSAANALTLATHAGAAVAHSSTTISDTAFHFLAITKNGATTKIYIDGVDVTTADANSTFASAVRGNTTFIGAGSGGAGSSTFGGTIDEVSLIVGTALTAAQIAEEYAVGGGGTLTRYGLTTNITPAGGDAPAPIRTIVTAQNGSAVASHWQLLDGTRAEYPPVYLDLRTAASANQAIVFDGPNRAVYLLDLGNVAAWWPFQDPSGTTILDFSGKSRDAVANAVTLSADGPDVRAAIAIDGTFPHYINYSGSGLNGITNMSAGCWFNRATHNFGTSNGIMGRAQLNRGWALFFALEQLTAFVGNGTTVYSAPATITLTDNAWHLAVMTRDATSGVLSLYVDGELLAQTRSTAYGESTGSTTLGMVPDPRTGTATEFKGSITEPFILSTVLTQSQVAAIARAGSLAAGLGTRLRPSGAWPDWRPGIGATLALQVAAYQQTTAPTIRVAHSLRGRYA